MGTLRVAFLSGAVLELAATLGIALVAVTVGVRLVEGGVGFEAGLTVLVLAPELYLPLPEPRGAVPRERRRPRGRGAPPRPHRGRPGARSRRHARPPSPSEAPIRLERTSRSPIRPGRARARRRRPRAGAGRDGRARRAERRRQEHDRLAPPPPRGADERPPARGGVDLAACDAAAWRAQIAWVPQRPTLFRGTVADNIRLGDPPPTTPGARAAALAGADAFVAELPDGYETVVGDGGRPLSAGQLQRIALARAFLRDAPLVILDEPTANLDPDSAELVGEAVERLRGGRTVLLIVHRPELAAGPTGSSPSTRAGSSSRRGRRHDDDLRRLVGVAGVPRRRAASPSSSARSPSASASR